jgi:outer membrane protein TolC
MAQVAEAREGMGRADGELSLARYGFNRALGRPLNAPAILESALPLPIAPQTPDAALAVAGRERPELLILKEQLLAAKAGAELASSESRPTLSVRGEVNEQTPTAFTREHYAAVSLQMRWPILDGDRAKIDTTQARAEARRVETLLEDARLGIMLEVLRAWQKMCDARTAIDSAAVRVHAYQVTETVAEKAYEVGRGTVIEVQSARRELNDARERLRRATYDLYAADAEFDHAQGRFPAGAPTGTPAGLKE